MSDISLTAGVRANLNSLQDTTKLLERTQERISTGKAVNSAIDDPTSFFAAANLSSRADDLSARLDTMGQAVQTVTAADAGITAMESILDQMKGVVNDALSETDSNSRADLGKQFNELIRQVTSIASDSGYAGVNLLNYDSSNEAQQLEVQFNESINISTLVIEGFDIAASTDELDTNGEMSAATKKGNTSTTITGVTVADQTGSEAALVIQTSNGNLGIKSYGTDATGATEHEVDWSATTYKENLADVISSIESFTDELETQSKGLANNLNVITIREDFTEDMINILNDGADSLTLADLNEEGANLLSLQTSQQLGVSALSIASQTSQSVLSIIG